MMLSPAGSVSGACAYSGSWNAASAEVIAQPLAVKTVGRGLHAVTDLLQGCKHSLNLLEEQFARPRQPRAAAGTDEQLLAHVFFKFLGSARQRRLLDVQPLGSAGEVEFFCNGQKTMQVS